MQTSKIFFMKEIFFLQKISFLVLGKLIFFKIPKNLTAVAILLYMSWQKPQHLLTAEANFECC